MDIQQYINIMGYSSLSAGFLSTVLVLAVWSIIWKGIALWKAARNNSTAWFVVMLIVNTVGILEIIYVFFFSKKSEKQNS